MKKTLVGVVVASLLLTPFTSTVHAKENNVKKSSKHSRQDKDSNEIPDWWQSKYHLGFGKNVASKDKDKDGLNNLVEYELNLNPISKDSDKDGNEDSDKDGIANKQEVRQMKINIVNHEGKKLSISYQSLKYKNKYKIKDEIGISNVKSLLDNFIVTPSMTDEEITSKIKEVFGINDIIKYELEVKFQNGKKVKSEFENRDNEQKQDDDDHDDNDHDDHNDND
ncbi:hypothetical protein TPDSL_27580 [Terrisporobacter petrolearius]|uniref:hypothetical protein n=1 Tax=Terrisporobacter petrolearius TaxID=1460447 RepID=UPI003366C90B